jgi:ElaB/YqjD/DUF883 family membrane-anchored ribosome-binding protein
MNAFNIEGLSAELGKILAEIEATLKAATADAGDGVDHAQAHVHASLRRACQHLRAAQREIVERAHSLDGAVRANPWQAVAATGLAAFLLGYWSRRR